MDAPSLSLASDIVELVVLTADEAFLQTLREAVGASRRLWHVASPDKVSDLLLAGGVGILVLDVQALLQQPGNPFISQIKLQFPDLVIVVAGGRDAEAELARLISNGAIYRFIHKPMSPARAQLFADAAVKRYDEQRKRTPRVGGTGASPRKATLWIVAATVVICAVGGALWTLRRGERMSAAPAESPAQASAETRDAPHPAVPSVDPSRSIAGAREQLLAQATNALLEERLDEAASAIEAARQAGADDGRLALLSTELAKARAQMKATAHSKSRAAMTQDAVLPEPARAAAPEPAETSAAPDAADSMAAAAHVDKLPQALAAAEHRADEGAPAKPSAEPPEAVRPASSSEEQAAAPSREPAPPTVADASRLTLVKSVQPEYPKEARSASIAGWVELDFTVAASGRVQDISVHAANPRGVFDRAAISALSQWRYQPLSAASAQRARVRIRFTLTR